MDPDMRSSDHPSTTDKGLPKDQIKLSANDFLSIFAQNDLLLDSTDLSHLTSNSDTWNYTLPNPRKRPERPKTLTPPPRFQGGASSSQNPFKNQDWRLYVKGAFGFQPIENNVKPPENESRNAYTKPKPKNPYVCNVKYQDDAVIGGAGPKRNNSEYTGPIRPIPTKPQVGIKLGAHSLSVNKKINLESHYGSCQGFQRPKSLGEVKPVADIKPAVSAPSLGGKVFKAKMDNCAKLSVQTEHVEEVLPVVKSPTIERKTHPLSARVNVRGDDAMRQSAAVAKPPERHVIVRHAVIKKQGDQFVLNPPKSSYQKGRTLSGNVSQTSEYDNENAEKLNARNEKKGRKMDQGTQCVQFRNLDVQCDNPKKSTPNKSSMATRIASPTRNDQPDLILPPPPSETKVEPPKKSVMRHKSPEKKTRRARSRSRSNSGGEADLDNRRNQNVKVSTSTQTDLRRDKRNDRRRKSDPGYVPRGVLRSARVSDMSKAGDLAQSAKLDTDNNNVLTAIVKPRMKAEVKKLALEKDSGVDINKNCHGKQNVNKMKATGDEATVTAQTQHQSLSENQISERRSHNDQDLVVQDDMYISGSSKKKQKNGDSSKSRTTYMDGVGRLWQRDRRVSAKPFMPAIAEHQNGSDTDTDAEPFDSSTGSSTKSNKDHSRSLSSSSSTLTNSDGQPSPEGPPPPLPPRRQKTKKQKPPKLIINPAASEPKEGDLMNSLTPPCSPNLPRSPTAGGSAPSLLDSLHRRYYPRMYQALGSVDLVPGLRHSNPEVTITSHNDNGPHVKSASFVPEISMGSSMMSDAEFQHKIEQHLAQLGGGSDTNSTKSSTHPSPCSTLSPPSIRKTRNLDSSEGESNYGSLSSSTTGVEIRPCTDICLTMMDEEALKSMKNERELAEIEAVEACTWLRAAGFPQYAQMYEDQQFPIDISSVENDHDFLDKDSIQSLFRRLNTLNKCANMKIEAPPRKSGDESDEEEQCALSDKWRFQRSSRRWSRRDLDDVLMNANDKNADDSIDKSGLRSCSSHDSVLTDNEQSLSQLEDSPLLHPRSTHRHGSVPDSPFYDHAYPANLPVPTPGEKSERRSMSPISPRLRRAASERFKGAKIFLKRIESFKTKKNKTKKAISPGGRVEISGPVVMDSGSFQERMDRLGCVDISPSSEKSPLLEPVTLRQRSSDSSHSTSPILKEPVITGPQSPVSKRNGCVFLDSSSSIPSGSSTLSEGQSRSEDPLYNLEHLTPPPTVYPGGHRRNHSSSDIMDVYSPGSSDPKQSSYPMLTSNGYIETINGNQINYRTGSFNLGSDSSDYREGLSKRTAAKRTSESTIATSNVTSPTTTASSEATKSRESKSSDSRQEHRLSVYDNVPASDASDAQHELDMILHDLFQNIDGLSKSLALSVYDEPAKENSDISDVTVESAECSDAADSAMPPLITTSATSPTSQTSGLSLATKESLTTSSSCHVIEDGDQASASSSNHELSDGDTPGSREEDGSDLPEARERRDSGVGSSLTRAPSDKRRHRIRWHSFVKSHRPSFNSRSLQISNMSAGQLMVLRKLSLLKVTALMEKYSPSNRSGWNWIMPKFIKRFKTPDYKDKQVFGVPLLVVLQRTGQPLPQCILYAMRSLRRTARDAVGIFRKSGVRSRIQKLHTQIEINPDVDFNSLQAYDVADLLKQYFRELPECLLTNKLSETFITTFTHVPPEARLEALQAAVMLLPDENREVLQSLLLFLSDMAEHASENQMTASNLAVCFAPSLFHMCGPRNNPSASPKRNRKNMGIPDQKDLMEQKAAHECLTAMITDCKRMFTVPEDMLSKCRFSYIEQGDPVCIEDLTRRRGDSETGTDHTAYIESCIQGLLRESHNKFKGWISMSTSNNTDVAYKKVGDGHPLRLWKCSVDVEAPPTEVLDRILHERHIWDEDLLKWRVVETLDKETDVFQYVTNNMAPHPTHDFTELRSWRTNLPKGACVLVSTSVEHPDAGLIGVVRGVTLASRYLIEPCGSGKSRLTHMCRIDLRGHTPEWYNKVYGHLCANYCARIRDSFKQDMDNTAGPETKV